MLFVFLEGWLICLIAIFVSTRFCAGCCLCAEVFLAAGCFGCLGCTAFVCNGTDLSSVGAAPLERGVLVANGFGCTDFACKTWDLCDTSAPAVLGKILCCFDWFAYLERPPFEFPVIRSFHVLF